MVKNVTRYDGAVRPVAEYHALTCAVLLERGMLDLDPGVRVVIDGTTVKVTMSGGTEITLEVSTNVD